MLRLQPRDLFVAVIGFWDRTTLAVNQQVIAAPSGKIFDERKSLPAPRVIFPGLTPHDDTDLIEVVELPVGFAHINKEEIDMRPFFSERLSDRLRNCRIIFSIHGDQRFIATSGLAITYKPDVTLTILQPPGQRTGIWHQFSNIDSAKLRTRRPTLTHRRSFYSRTVIDNIAHVRNPPIKLHPELFLRLPEVAQVHVLFRRGRGFLQDSVAGLNLQVHFETFKSHRAISRIDLVFGVIIDASTGVRRLDTHFGGEKLSRLVGPLVNPAHALNMGLQKLDNGGTVLLRPSGIDIDGIELIVGDGLHGVA